MEIMDRRHRPSSRGYGVMNASDPKRGECEVVGSDSSSSVLPDPTSSHVDPQQGAGSSETPTPPPRRGPLGVDTPRPILGRSRSLLDALDLLERVAPREIPVLLVGESGTGKELFARALHRKSPRRSGPFLAVNCGAMTGSLIESELFGYEKGAFTGATQTTKGLFEEACGGTLFLDEVHELSPAAQVSLLRVLQEGEIRRVGGRRAIPVDVRIVAACPVDLAVRVDGKLFRSDLYYRLHVFPVNLPPLRERPEDIPLLVEHFLDQIAARERQPRHSVSAEAMAMLVGAAWPGNIRELQSVVERAAAMARSTAIGAVDIVLPASQRVPPLRQAAAEGRTLEEVEMAYILESLASNGNCRARTARQLGISTNTLWRKLRQAGLVDGGSSGEREAAREGA
jgi:DNA-binding NtrC family response regulator